MSQAAQGYSGACARVDDEPAPPPSVPGPFLRPAPFTVPAKAKGKTKIVKRPVLHAWLVYYEGNRRLKQLVRLDTLELRTEHGPLRASPRALFLSRQLPLPGLEGQHRYLCQATLDAMRAGRADG